MKIISNNLKKYLLYESISLYYEYIKDDEKSEEYADKAVNIWLKLDDHDINYLNNRGVFVNDKNNI